MRYGSLVAPEDYKAASIKLELSPAQMARFRKRMERWRGAPLARRASAGTVKAAEYLVPIMKRYAPRSSSAAARRTRGKPGTLRKSIRVRRGKRGIITDAYVGPTAPHSFLVTRGTERHGLAPKRAGRGNLLLLPPGRGRGARVGNVNVRTASGVTHPGATPNPFVDETQQKHHGDAMRIVDQMLFAE